MPGGLVVKKGGRHPLLSHLARLSVPSRSGPPLHHPMTLLGASFVRRLPGWPSTRPGWVFVMGQRFHGRMS